VLKNPAENAMTTNNRESNILMSHPTPTHADRVARSLKRLGFRMTRAGRSFSITDGTGELAIGSKPGMSLQEIEVWIGKFIKPTRS
jgi:hypothetical protein